MTKQMYKFTFEIQCGCSVEIWASTYKAAKETFVNVSRERDH